ncbi:GNAT family N-acetyltransferase [Bacillus sp. EB106-08-02-XG196]|uniref:GNAT family N-acetyltransferase n=1 Tax=Bacillus sp. EB106-08-02-XG196 TaxID=2737049 RepID=UPI0015C4837A|nr:GNAT family N-acetyltransferase [Bacillus sp. EB106-08-02-XG196]NWQ41669.1 GNAT family N-acetyltransferase [Bacillus sp. EB106-08-02-XG196]
MSRLDRLKMGKVETKHFQQFNQLLRYVFQVTKKDLQMIGWEEREIALAKKPVLDQADVLGWFDGEKLVSQLAVYPFQVNIFGRSYEMGGLTGVGTYPEYANMGLMYKLMGQALADMRERKQSISYLFPYSIPYYRRRGWEIVSDKMTFEVRDIQLPKIKKVPGYVERLDIEHPDVRIVYKLFSSKMHVGMLRNDLAWDEYWRWDVDELTAALYYDSSHKPQGYLLYWISEDVLHIKEMVYMNQEARIGLWNFIGAHFSMVSKVVGNIFMNEPLAFWLEDGDINESISPYFMARIVCAKQFISQYPFKATGTDIQLTFMLEDPMLEWNQGTFTLNVSPLGQGKLFQSKEEPTFSLDIQTLTTMLLSYKRPSYLAAISRLKGNAQVVEILENIIERQIPYFSDYF